MKKLCFLILMGFLVTSCKDKEEYFTSYKGVVITLGVTEITATSAICGGYVFIDNVSCIDSIKESGICYGKTKNLIETGEKVAGNQKTGKYTAKLTNLTPKTKYYARAYTETTSGISFYGEETLEFKTLPRIFSDTIVSNLSK